MPVPVPRNNEEFDAFVKRGMSILVSEGRPNDQAYAILVRQYNEAKKKKRREK